MHSYHRTMPLSPQHRSRAHFSAYRAELPALIRLAVPVALAELGWMLQGVVDVIMVGRLGPTAIGAVALGNALYYAPSLFGLGLLLGLDTVIARSYGEGDFDACHRWLAQGIYIALASTPLLMGLLYAFAAHTAHFGVQPELVAPAAGYLRMLLWGTLPLLLYAAVRRYLQAVGQVRVITLTFVFANLVNWGANYVLINGKLGLPAMGVRGSALSTVLARTLMAAMLLGFAWRHERSRGHPLFHHWAAPHLRQLRQLLKLGIPTASQLLLEVGAFAVATVLAGRISADALAAHQIALNYAAMAYMVPLGISAAAAVSVGHALGAADPARARRAAILALVLGVGFMLCTATVFLLFPRPLTALYTHEAAIVALIRPLLALAALFAIFDAVQIILTGALRGMALTRVPMLANLVGYWIVGLPLGILLAFHGLPGDPSTATPYGIFGIWMGLTLALIVIAAILLQFWNKRSRKLLHAGSLPRF